MNRKRWIYIIFFSILFVGFYFALTRIIPGYGQASFPVLSTVKPFSFENQEGQRVNNRAVEGKVYVAEYFFTTCRGICPKLNTNLKDLYDHYKDDSDFLIVSHTVDPETDSAARLKVYADSMGVRPKRWLFLTGTKDSLYKAARESYLLDDPKHNSGNIAEQFIHTQFFALVDKNGQVRKIYDGLKKDELLSLQEGIDQLLKEKSNGPRFSNNLFTNNPN